MMYHWNNSDGEMIFSTEKSDSGTRTTKLQYWQIQDLLHLDIQADYLLFAHAWSGCDTTSAIYMKG